MDVNSGSPLLEMKNLKMEKHKNRTVEEKVLKTSGLLKAVRRGIRITEKYLNDQKEINALNLIETDLTGKNLFHLSVQREELLEFLLKKFEKHPMLKEALRSEDINGDTPIHVAAFHNERKSIQMLGNIDRKLLDVRSKLTGKSPIHCAVDSGNIYIVQYILEEQPDALFDRDANSRPPLHYAAALKDNILVEYLLSQGVDILETDDNGYSALHVAAESNSLSNVQLLVLDDVEILTMVDKSEQTALHIACKNGHRSIVSFLLESGADSSARDKLGCTALECAVKNKQNDVVEELLLSDRWRELIGEFKGGPKKCFAILVSKMPQSAQILLDRSVRKDGDPNSEDFSVTYDFFLVEPEGNNPPNFHGLTAILENERETCLVHNLCRKYFSCKWRDKGYKLYMLNFFIYVVFHVLFNAHIMVLRGAVTRNTIGDHENLTSTPAPRFTNYPKPAFRPHETGPIIATVLIVSFVVLNLIKELIQLYSIGWRYFKQVTNYLEWTLFISVLYFMFPVRRFKTERQFGVGSIAVFLTWFNLIWYMRRVPDIGTYILTLQKVFKTLMKMLLIIVLFCLAFASIFYLLLAEYDRYRSFHLAVISTFVSMLGDFDYDDLFAEVGYHRNFYNFKLAAFVVFLLIMGVVVNNVLIGLAVGDTDYVINQAKVQRLRQQAKFIIQVESSMFSKIPCCKMETETIYTEYPNHELTFTGSLKRVMFGEGNLLDEAGDEDANEDDASDKITEEKVGEIVKSALEIYHKQMIEELKQLHFSLIAEINPSRKTEH